MKTIDGREVIWETVNVKWLYRYSWEEERYAKQIKKEMMSSKEECITWNIQEKRE